MTWNLFLDNERFPPDDGREWVIARSFSDAVIEVINRGFPDYISFDHDLGDISEKTGYDFAKILVEKDMKGHIGYTFSENFSYYVHSQNPVGKKNIESYLNSYLKFKET